MLGMSLPSTAYGEDVPPADPGVSGEDTNTGEPGTDSDDADPGAGTGDGGAGGSEGEVGDDGDVVPVTTKNDVPEDGTEGDDGEEGDTGGITKTSTTTAAIDTGDATAVGDITTNANNSTVSSQLSSTTPEADLDDYTFMATGTNETIVENTATTSAQTGENKASSSDAALIETGDATALLNIANIINTNIVNSTGFIQLLNTMLEAGASLDLREIFFPDGDGSGVALCSLVSCHAENITYTIDQTNTGEIENDVLLEAITGLNAATGTSASVTTGDAFAAANLLNVANANIIDSNYLLLALNALGSLDGDLVLPNADLFMDFFARPNGVNQVEDAEDATLNADNLNNATTTNDIHAVAESGLNQATTTLAEAVIQTGEASAESNIVNEINKNLFGGDSLYVMIRIHGSWNGHLFGLPDGLAWTRTADGVLIYSEDAEIAPSQIVALDVDSYTANFTNQNDITIDNDVDMLSLSGENTLQAGVGAIGTGDAYAGANVMNIANTNVIGRNWVMATMNIFGDINGDITFGRPDLWVGGKAESSATPIGPGAKVTYTYTVTNRGDLKATNVELAQELQSAYSYYAEDGDEARGSTRREPLGTIRPGETVEVAFDAFVLSDIPYGTTPIEAIASVTSDEPDDNDVDNTESLTLIAERREPSSGGGGSGGGGGDRSGGRVLGAKVNRDTDEEIDPSAHPKLSIEKTASYEANEVIEAGSVVEYTILVENDGGQAYNAKVVDTLINPIGAIVNEQSWELGTILAGERIELSYEIKYDENTPSGTYKNTARLTANEEENDPESVLEIDPATHTLVIEGVDLAVGNVRVIGVYPNSDGTSAAIIAWETTKPTDAQIFLSEQNGVSPYNPLAFNYGYDRTSIRLPMYTTKHYMYLPNLANGTEYTYRIRSSNGTNTAFGGDYTLFVPGTAPAPVVAQVPQPAPKKTVAVAPKKVAPVQQKQALKVAEPEPLPQPPQTTIEPAPEPRTATTGIASMFAGVVDTVFGFFGG